MNEHGERLLSMRLCLQLRGGNRDRKPSPCPHPHPNTLAVEPNADKRAGRALRSRTSLLSKCACILQARTVRVLCPQTAGGRLPKSSQSPTSDGRKLARKDAEWEEAKGGCAWWMHLGTARSLWAGAGGSLWEDEKEEVTLRNCLLYEGVL